MLLAAFKRPMSRRNSSPCDKASIERLHVSLLLRLGGGGGVEREYNVQNSFVSWSRIALNDDGSNEPVVTACSVHDLAVAS